MNYVDVEEIRKKYVKGAKVRLIHMEDDAPWRTSPCPGDIMTVEYVDDMGQIHGTWSDGGSLALLPDVDSFTLVKED